DAAHGFSLGRVDNERALARVVAERHVAAHPYALLLRGGDLVADPFAGDLPLELGKGQQHIEGQPPHRARGIELLGHRHERLALCLERVELLLKPFLGGFAGVDGAALAARVSPRHGWPPSSRRPEPKHAMTHGPPIGLVSARRTAVPTTPCR